MAEEKDSFYFDVNWEVCTRSGSGAVLIRNRFRSAVRLVGRYYYIAGPDLKSGPEFARIEESWPDLVRHRAPLGAGDWRLPGEPRAVFANFGKKINSKFHLYELWQDSGLEIENSGWDFFEPVMFNHACSLMLEFVAGPHRSSRPAAEPFFGTGRLCVKKKAPEPEIILSSTASFTGKKNTAGKTSIYFEATRMPAVRSAVLHRYREIIPAKRPGAPSLALAGIADEGLSPPTLQSPETLTMLLESGYSPVSGADKEPHEPARKHPVTRFVTGIMHEKGKALSSFLWILNQP